jgi:lysophospholipase L1-like esterase
LRPSKQVTQEKNSLASRSGRHFAHFVAYCKLPSALAFCALIVCPNGGHAQTAPTPLPAASAIPPAAAIPFWAQDKNGALIPAHDEHAVPATPPPRGLYVAMGDSITFGIGATQDCHAFPAHPVDIAEYCPDGTSYAIRTALALRTAGAAGHFINLGIAGARVERVISDELPYLPAKATLVTLYIGTNDSRAVRDPGVSFDDVVANFETHFDQLLAMIHTRAPRARIVLINFPNQKYLAAGYHVADDVLPRYDATSQTLTGFIDTHYPRYAVVDTICNPASYDDHLRWNGTVHPNDAGADILAQSVVKVVLDKNPPPPPNSCAWFDPRTEANLARRPAQP